MLHMTKEELQGLAVVLPDIHATVVLAVSRIGMEECLYHLTTESEYNEPAGEQVYIRYFGHDVHGQVQMDLPGDKTYIIEVIDTRNMICETVDAGQSSFCKVRVPKNSRWQLLLFWRIRKYPDNRFTIPTPQPVTMMRLAFMVTAASSVSPGY